MRHVFVVIGLFIISGELTELVVSPINLFLTQSYLYTNAPTPKIPDYFFLYASDKRLNFLKVIMPRNFFDGKIKLFSFPVTKT